jgi:hypothetical protein
MKAVSALVLMASARLPATLGPSAPATPKAAAPHDQACRDYVVTAGKRAAWVSSADCPAGPHTKGTKPLCCQDAAGT